MWMWLRKFQIDATTLWGERASHAVILALFAGTAACSSCLETKEKTCARSLLPLLQRRSEPKGEGLREPLFPASRGRVPGRPCFGENEQQG